ncbi:MAG: hypothetical protein NTV05_09955 [Acidobacteria bacterium]|nr:hypothetical protein [Acidobacteriota bacterium]
MTEIDGHAARLPKLSSPSQPANLATQQALGDRTAPSTHQFINAGNLPGGFIGCLDDPVSARRVVAVHQIDLIFHE